MEGEGGVGHSMSKAHIIPVLHRCNVNRVMLQVQMRPAAYEAHCVQGILSTQALRMMHVSVLPGQQASQCCCPLHAATLPREEHPPCQPRPCWRQLCTCPILALSFSSNSRMPSSLALSAMPAGEGASGAGC